MAIQDVHQHMYFAVDGEENKYSLVGTAHYSLVGERALFRVWVYLYSHCTKDYQLKIITYPIYML